MVAKLGVTPEEVVTSSPRHAIDKTSPAQGWAQDAITRSTPTSNPMASTRPRSAQKSLKTKLENDRENAYTLAHARSEILTIIPCRRTAADARA